MNEQPKPNNHRKKLLVLVVLLIIAGSAVGYYFYTRGRLTTDDAYVEGRIFTVTPRVAGYVTEVLVQDNQRVAQGEPLAFLDPTEYEVALAEAKAGLAEAEATLASLELGVPLELNQTGHRVDGAQAALASLAQTIESLIKEEEAAAQEVKRSQAQFDQALLDLDRMKALLKKQAVAQSQVDEARTKTETAQAQLRAAQARLAAVRKQRASLEANAQALKSNVELAATGHDLAAIKSRQVEAQKARVQLARARVKQAELNLQYAAITSPTDGYVTKKRIESGVMIARGQAIMAVVPLDPKHIWITANYKETQLTDVRPGQEVAIKVDTYPEVRFKGRVDSIMAGAGAAFSLFPPENASGNFVKVVQRIPVKITLDLSGRDSWPVLRVGMSVIPTIFTE